MSKLNVKALRDERAAIVRKGEKVVSAYTSEDRDPTEEEVLTLTTLASERDALDVQITEAEKRADLERGFHVVREGADISGGKPRVEDDPKRGFTHFGEFCRAVMRGAGPQKVVDQRLMIGAAPTSYGNESAGADGGFAVPVEFSTTIAELMLEQDSLLPLTDSDAIAGNRMSFPADETTPWGTTGVRSYWEGEGDQATQTKPLLKNNELQLRKLFALVPMTDELLADTAAMGSYVERKSAIDIRYKVNDAIVNGNGAGKPMGILNAASTVSQAKEGSQPAATITSANVGKMYGRVIGAQMGTWLVNPDAWNQLFQLTVGDTPVFIPPQGFTQAPGGMLLGRPVVLSDTCATLGTVGDIIFGNFLGYKTITKSGGIQMAQSMHLWFDYDVTAFRAIFRVDGQPWLSAAVSPAKGSTTRSHFCTLATRA